MKYNITHEIKLFTGATAMTGPEGDTRPMTLRDAIEVALLNASPEAAKTGEQKHKLFLILDRVHSAEVEVDLSAEDVSLVKRVVGDLFTVPMVGAVYKLLEAPQG